MTQETNKTQLHDDNNIRKKEYCQATSDPVQKQVIFY